MTDIFDLSGFQRDLLYVLSSGEKLSGQDIKGELERELDEVTRGRLYPNLDTLVEAEFVEKGQFDRRTNYYRITDRGLDSLRYRRRWENKYLQFEK